MTGKLFIKTHGCQMNEYDSAKMADVLAAAHGLELTDNETDADVILINTCSIREKAQEKVFSQLGRWKALKQANRSRRDRRRRLRREPGRRGDHQARAVRRSRVRSADAASPAEMIEARRATGNRRSTSRFPEIEKFDRLPEPRTEGPTAFVSIMEGCSKYCTFCVVPYTRGEEISRPFDDVARRDRARSPNRACAKSRCSARTSTRIADRCTECRAALRCDVADLGLLIHAIAEIDGIGRIRFTTSHPLEFSDSLIDAYANVPKLANFLHLPVQSGSDRILAAMKRGYTALEFKQKIRKLREVRPDISISSDFIVGFPGRDRRRFREDDETHRRRRLRSELLVHLFETSRHAGRESRRRHEPTRSSTNASRACRRRSTRTRRRIGEAMVGSVQRVLVEGPSKKTRERTDRPHREHALRQFPRRCAHDRPIRRRDDHRGDEQLAARTRRACERRCGDCARAVNGALVIRRDRRGRVRQESGRCSSP